MEREAATCATSLLSCFVAVSAQSTPRPLSIRRYESSLEKVSSNVAM
jgi:hypothetical protein